MLLTEKAAPGRLQSSCVSGTTAPHTSVHQACPVLSLGVSLALFSCQLSETSALLSVFLFAVPHSS